MINGFIMCKKLEFEKDGQIIEIIKIIRKVLTKYLLWIKIFKQDCKIIKQRLLFGGKIKYIRAALDLTNMVTGNPASYRI